MVEFDLVVRGGHVIDGTGTQGCAADVAVRDGTIVEVGRVAGKGTQEITADGAIVTPGFVDIHTHYDGQVTWANRLHPSSHQGVTTVVMGNCGVGFAPVRPDDHDMLIELMEGVEDIPGSILHEGLSWDWETFPDYMDVLSQRRFDMDVGAQIPHAALRVVCVEADAGWVPHYMYRMDHGYERHRNWMDPGVELSKMPSEYFREHIYTTFQDDYVAFKSADQMNWRRLLWASDFPHSDSTWPWSQDVLTEQTVGLSEEQLEGILSGNVAELYGIDRGTLTPTHRLAS